jgi:hypothetical protein
MGKIEKLLSICGDLEEAGEKEMAYQLFEKVCKKIKFIKRDDWIERQICGDFPKVDSRCLVFCCSPFKLCVYRNTILEKMGLSVDDYTRMKEKFAINFER